MTVWVPVFLSYLGTNPVKNTDFTLFVVHAITAYAGLTTGLTDPSYKFGLVPDDAPPAIGLTSSVIS
jgi:hypothetical protein